MSHSKRSAFLIGATAFCLFISSTVSAQTGPELLLNPWPSGQQVQTQGYAVVQGNGSTRNSDDFDLATYDFSGRARLLSSHRADPRFGWNFTKIRTSGDPALPPDLIDTSVGFGMGIADWDGWLAGITVGLGYAGAGAFDDGNAYYGMADLLVGRELAKDSSLGFVIDYDGNRTFMPDVPLPGFLYTKRIYETLKLGVGFPYSSVEYTPNTEWTFKAQLAVPDGFLVRVDYGPAEHFGVYAEYNYRREAFHSDDLSNSHDRIIYDARRMELGVRWSPNESTSLLLAGGYSFGQEFNVGFDTREQDRIARPSDEPYVRLGFEFRY